MRDSLTHRLIDHSLSVQCEQRRREEAIGVTSLVKLLTAAGHRPLLVPDVAVAVAPEPSRSRWIAPVLTGMFLSGLPCALAFDQSNLNKLKKFDFQALNAFDAMLWSDLSGAVPLPCSLALR